MEKSSILKVFLPQCLLNAESGVCLGLRSHTSAVVCIVAVVHSHCKNVLGAYLEKASRDFSLDLCIVGTYLNKRMFMEDDLGSECDLMIELDQRHHNGIPACKVRTSPWQHTANQLDIGPLLIIFDEAQVLKANMTTLSQSRVGSKQTLIGRVQSSSQELFQQPKRPSTEFEFVCSAVQQYAKFIPFGGASSVLPVTHIVPDSNGGRKLFKNTCKICCVILTILAKQCCRCVNFVCNAKLCRSSIVRKVVTYPATGAQLADKSHHFCDLIRNETEAKNSATQSTGESTLEFIKTGNTVCTLIVDLLLGILLLTWMYVAGVPRLFAAVLASWADTTAIGLQQLLQWLMGAPAGLKLNTSLAHFLGNFFLYHIYLWIGYLNILWPVMTILLWCIAASGILGLSVQLAMTSDLLSLLTFHIYCFYVYAARIYSLQVAALLSLARLFQGKKWNILRQRVDSCSYDVDQLFMGTLLFTVLLFLLPTTALFYVVFTALRLIILVLQSLLTLIRDFLHTFPWFSVLLWLVGSNMLNSGIEFHILQSLPWQPTCLVLQMQMMPFSDAVKLGRTESSIFKEKESLVHLSKKLIRGQLIYPWGGDRDESSQ